MWPRSMRPPPPLDGLQAAAACDDVAADVRALGLAQDLEADDNVTWLRWSIAGGAPPKQGATGT